MGKLPLCTIIVMSIKFPNSVGLCVGFDKNGDYLSSLGGLGFAYRSIYYDT